MIKTMKNKVRNASIAVVAAVATSPALASNTEAITAAIDAAKGDVGLTTSGVIAVAALGFGLGMVVSWLRK